MLARESSLVIAQEGGIRVALTAVQMARRLDRIRDAIRSRCGEVSSDVSTVIDFVVAPLIVDAVDGVVEADGREARAVGEAIRDALTPPERR